MTLRGRALRIALMFVVALVLVEIATRRRWCRFPGTWTDWSFPVRARDLAAAPARASFS